MTWRYEYDENFYHYINDGAIRSAEAIVPLVLSDLDISSVADFGCGQGAWLSVWQRHGVASLCGVDGDYVDREHLLVASEHFNPADLSRPVRLRRKFDLVQSLEVAEHLPEQAADEFIRTLVSHGDVVMFSAATPGQGGENHLNEQTYEYWRAKFRAHGYVPIDLIRPQVKGERGIEPWYRYNILLYVNTPAIQTLPPVIGRAVVPENVLIPDVAPRTYQIRRMMVRVLPTPVACAAAVLKKHCVLAARVAINHWR